VPFPDEEVEIAVREVLEVSADNPLPGRMEIIPMAQTVQWGVLESSVDLGRKYMVPRCPFESDRLGHSLRQ
jgi:hypothetical protein